MGTISSGISKIGEIGSSVKDKLKGGLLPEKNFMDSRKEDKVADIAAAQTPVMTAAESRAEIQKDIELGQSTLGKEFEEGKMGRLDTGRSADMADIINRRRAGLEGLSAQENQAIREKGKLGIQQNLQTGLRSLRGIQGATGVRGAAAGAQQARMVGASQQAGANVERDLLIRNVQEKRLALGGFEESVTGAEGAEEARELFNIKQKQKETFGRLSSGLGMAQLGTQERASARGVATAQASTLAAAQSGKK